MKNIWLCLFRACGTKRPKPCVVCSCGKAISATEETASCGSLRFIARNPTHRRRCCGYVSSEMSVTFLPLAVGHYARKRFFCAKILRTGGTSVAALPFDGRAWRQPSANFRVPWKFGHSVRALSPHNRLILPRVRSGTPHEKRLSRPWSPKGLYKREKNWISKRLKKFPTWE